MKDYQPYPFAGLAHNHESGLNNYATWLELVPHAVLLIDSHSGQIILGNTQATELSAYTHKEIGGMLLTTLLPEWDQDAYLYKTRPIRQPLPEHNQDEMSTIHLVKRDKTQVIVALNCIAIDPQGKRYLLSLQPYSDWGHPRNSHHRRFWETVKALVEIKPHTQIEEALSYILETGSLLTRSNILCLYHVSDQKPVLSQLAGYGAFRLLPEHLSVQELTQLSHAQVWSTGKRSNSALQRAARKTNLTYLACVPIGKGGGAIGLLVVADTQAALPTDILPLTDFLATVIRSTIQRFAQIKETDTKLVQQTNQVQIAAILEERMQEGVLYLDKSLNIIHINMSAELMLGYTRNEVAGQPVDKVLIGTQSLLPALEQAKLGSPTYNLENVRLYRRGGDAFLPRVGIYPSEQIEGPNPVLVLIQDLSDQEQLNRRAKEFEQRAVLGDVTAIFAHEVRNPINNISTGLQLMSLNLADEDPNQEAIDRMLQDCDRMEALIKSVLAFSRPAEYEMETLDVPLLIKRLLERQKARITRLGIQYEFQSEPDCPHTQGNLRALEQVFTNLIQNALDAMESAGGRLGIKINTVKSPGNRLQIQVNIADTGPGIPKEDQEKIFQPFVTNKKDGTGLGLAIAKQIITAHKGDLSLTSFPGGTLFQVHLPVNNQT